MIDWKERYMREVEGLNNEGDPIGGDPPSGLRHQVEALKAEIEELKEENRLLDGAYNIAHERHQKQNEAQAKRITELESEDEISAAVIEKCSHLLSAIAVTLKGEQKELSRHSHHDLPELVSVLHLENELNKQRITELESEIGWINSLQGEDVMYETILARAKQSYIRHKYSVRGQILTRDDDLQTHIIHAAIEYAASKNGDSK